MPGARGRVRRFLRGGLDFAESTLNLGETLVGDFPKGRGTLFEQVTAAVATAITVVVVVVVDVVVAAAPPGRFPSIVPVVDVVGVVVVVASYHLGLK